MQAKTMNEKRRNKCEQMQNEFMMFDIRLKKWLLALFYSNFSIFLAFRHPINII